MVLRHLEEWPILSIISFWNMELTVEDFESSVNIDNKTYHLT